MSRKNQKNDFYREKRGYITKKEEIKEEVARADIFWFLQNIINRKW